MAKEVVTGADRAPMRYSAAHSSLPPEREAIVQSVKASLRIAQAHTARRRRTDALLFVVSTVSPAAATLVAALAAVFSFIATVCSALRKQSDERLAQGNECVGRLMALDVAFATGHLS